MVPFQLYSAKDIWDIENVFLCLDWISIVGYISHRLLLIDGIIRGLICLFL